MVEIRRYKIDFNCVTKILTGFVAALLVLLVSVANAESLLKAPEKIQSLLEEKKITEKQIPDPHWHSGGCIACHSSEASSDNRNLRTEDISALCNNCHKTGKSHSIIHPVGISPDKIMLRRMPGEFSKAIKHSNGKMDCLTCHDVVQACNEDREQVRALNPKFFRGGNYQEDRASLCFYCHEEGQYERLNPHKQIAGDGSVNEKSCYVCHKNMPDGERITDIGQLYFNVENNYSSVEDNYSLMCSGCHPKKPHPGGSFSFQTSKEVDHLVVPSARVMRLIQASDIYLPLEPGTRRVFCGTCHNAHEKGVIKKDRSAQGAGSKNFLRDQNICIHCHAK
jgi:predicted CXXCH cytochrome family protein